jgi:disulfide bond formation protein DsbB
VTGLFSNPTRTFALAAGACVFAVGAALVTQHVFGMQPCPWCILQRLIFLSIALVAVVGMLWRTRAGVVTAALAMDLLAACGVAAALWQHFVAASSASCNLTLADRIVAATGLDGLAPEIFAPRASCSDAAVLLLGAPYEFWSLATFAMLGALAVLVLLSQIRRTARPSGL